MEAEPPNGRAVTVRPASHRGRALLLAAMAYLLLAVVLWWHVWTNHPTATTTCGCGDSSLFAWFIEWPSYALAHGLNPFASHAAGYPGGVNLLANTGVVAIGIVLAPISWLFGPIASMNVALTLAPALSALAMFVLVRRWVSWAPAAFFAGLLYGFSPFVLVSLDDAHLMLGMAFVPPLVVACLDELFFRSRRSAVGTGILLGLLVTLQFFIGTEVLVIMVISLAIGVAMVAVYAVCVRPDDLGERARRAGLGLGLALFTAGLLLSYPAWFALAGPGHLSGLVWPNFHPGFGGNTVGSFVRQAPALSSGFFGSTMSQVVGGSQGPVLSSQYFGFGTAAVVLVGTVIWWRDRRLWLLWGVALTSGVLSLGEKHSIFLPWQLVANLPLLENISASRFVLIVYLAAAGALGIIVDHCRSALVRDQGHEHRHRSQHRHSAEPSHQRRSASGGRRMLGAAAGTAVAAVALVPVGLYQSSSLPYTTRPVVLPTWFATVAPHLDRKQVLLVLPAPFADTQAAMTWQAVDKMSYSMAGQGGPAGTIGRAGVERPGQAAITNATFFFSPDQVITGTGAAAAADAIRRWGVTEVVLPDQPELPDYDRVRSTTHAAVLVTAATGVLPVYQEHAWVWRGVAKRRQWTVPSTVVIDRCLAGRANEGARAVEGATNCVSAGG